MSWTVDNTYGYQCSALQGKFEFPESSLTSGEGEEWLCAPKDTLPTLVNEYVELIGNSVTNEFCTCEWVIHPDDIDKAEGKRRLRKGEPSPLCWIHSKQGYLLGFFTWLFKVRNTNPEDGSDGGLFKVRDVSSSGAQATIQELLSDEEIIAEQARRDRVHAEQYRHDEPMMVAYGNADQMKWAARYLEMVKEGQALIDAGLWPKEMMKYLIPEKPKELTLDDHIEAASDALSAAGIDPVTGKRYGESDHPRQDYDG